MSHLEKSGGFAERKTFREPKVKEHYAALYSRLRQLCGDLRQERLFDPKIWESLIVEIENEIQKAEEALTQDTHRPPGTYVHIVLRHINRLRKKLNLKPIKRDELY